MEKPARRNFGIASTLAALLALLVLLAVVPVIVSSYLINFSNSRSLLSARAELIVDGMENQLRSILDPVAQQFETAKQHIETSGLDVENSPLFPQYVAGLLDGAPQLAGVAVLRRDGSMRRWVRDSVEAIEEPAAAIPLGEEALREIPNLNTTNWSAPFVSNVLRDTILNPRIAVELASGQTIVLTGGITGSQLSRYARELSSSNQRAFILYGRDRLVAYADAKTTEADFTSIELPSIEQSTFLPLQQIWSEQNPLTQTGMMNRTSGHWAYINGEPYAYFYREIAGYTPEPLMVGVVLPAAESRWFRWAPFGSALLGLFLLLVAMIAAIRIGRRIAEPVQQIDEALGKLESMHFDQVRLPDLEESRVSEWQSCGKKLRLTASALAQFNQYVPSKLARKLMGQSETAAIAAERRVTIMFIDMEGFSAFSMNRTAAATAAALNEVLGLIGPIIESSGGVIDKYTGDGLMAFWGAPDQDINQAKNALVAALQIRDTFVANALDEYPRLRVGIHTGKAITGNLGFAGRYNYTLVGANVNTTERIEQALRGKVPDERVILGISTSTLANVNPDILPAPKGRIDVEGFEVKLY